MRRRDVLKTMAGTAVAGVAGGGVAATLARPAIGGAAAARTLRFVPQANLANLDPVWGTQYVVRNAALMIWDTLYGVDANLQPQPQMAAGHELSSNELAWTITLREGLLWHTGERVTARDCVASIKRWIMRDTMGAVLRRQLDDIRALDDRRLLITLTKPFGKLPFALGKGSAPMCVMMPEHIAATDPFKQVSEFVGSGPMRFKRDEWVPGSRAVFTRFEDYVPRAEPSNWLSGGKRMLLDRIEWQIMPDPATASAALQNGEVDWWETPISDLVPLLRSSPDVKVAIADPLGSMGVLRLNHLYPPFNDPRARRALLMVMDQADYLSAVTGDDGLWKRCPGFFTPGTALYTEAGGDIMKGRRDVEGARRLLAESGYDGKPVTLLVAADIPIIKAAADVTAQLLPTIGMKVDYVSLDWGTVGQRRAKKDPPDKGGWNLFHTWFSGADCVNPAAYVALDASGDTAWFGWPKSEREMAAIGKWYAATSLPEEKAAIDEVSRAAFDNVTYAPTGFAQSYQAWRGNVSGIVPAPFVMFWGVQKT